MTRQPGNLPTSVPDNAAVGLVQVSDANGNVSWQPQSGSGGGISPPAGDIGGTAGSPTVVATHLSSALPIAQGGTASTTRNWVLAGEVPALAGANVSLYGAPSGATGVTFDRAMAAGASSPANTSGTLYVRAIALPSGIAVSNITFLVASTVQVTGTHGWYVLLDSSRVVQAVSADQTSTVWGSANTAVTLPVSASAYTTTYSGLYYVGFCTVSATNPVFAGGVTTSSTYTNLPPILMGTSNTGLTTPPSSGTTMTAITGNAGYNFLAWTS